MENEQLEFQCPSCQRVLTAPASRAGEELRCPSEECAATLRVPLLKKAPPARDTAGTVITFIFLLMLLVSGSAAIYFNYTLDGLKRVKPAKPVMSSYIPAGGIYAFPGRITILPFNVGAPSINGYWVFAGPPPAEVKIFYKKAGVKEAVLVPVLGLTGQSINTDINFYQRTLDYNMNNIDPNNKVPQGLIAFEMPGNIPADTTVNVYFGAMVACPRGVGMMFSCREELMTRDIEVLLKDEKKVEKAKEDYRREMLAYLAKGREIDQGIAGAGQSLTLSVLAAVVSLAGLSFMVLRHLYIGWVRSMFDSSVAKSQ